MIKKLMILTLCLIWSFFAFSNEIAEKYIEGMNCYDQGKYGKSIRIFKKILKKYPRASNLGRVQAQIGYAYEKQEKYKTDLINGIIKRNILQKKGLCGKICLSG